MGRWSRVIGWTLTLFLLWILFAQSFDVQSLVTGLIVAFLVALFNRDFLLSLTNDLHVSSNNVKGWVLFLWYLVIDIFKAGIQVAELAFARELRLDPHFVTHRTSLNEPMMRVTLANSITLTPGTLSVEAPAQGEFVVHALTREASEGLKDWHIENRLLIIERTH